MESRESFYCFFCEKLIASQSQIHLCLYARCSHCWMLYWSHLLQSLKILSSLIIYRLKKIIVSAIVHIFSYAWSLFSSRNLVGLASAVVHICSLSLEFMINLHTFSCLSFVLRILSIYFTTIIKSVFSMYVRSNKDASKCWLGDGNSDIGHNVVWRNQSQPKMTASLHIEIELLTRNAEFFYILGSINWKWKLNFYLENWS